MKKQNNKHKYIIHATGIAGILILLFIRIFSVQISNRNSGSPKQQKSVFAPYNQESPAGTDNKPRPQQHNPETRQNAPAVHPNASANQRDLPETRQNAPATHPNASANQRDLPETRQNAPAAHPNASANQRNLPETRQNTPATRQNAPATHPNASANQRDLPETRQNAPAIRQNAPATRQNAPPENSPTGQSPAARTPNRPAAQAPTGRSATYRAHTPMKIELNTADSAELVKLYGIGPYYAQKILEYRERLGGFAIPEQLLEIKGFDKDRLDGFYDRVFADTSFIRKINLKTASENQLANHLYIGRYLARCIIRYRDTADPDSCSVEHLVRHGILTQEQGQKIGWYLR